jgi:hypothetical protein
MAKWSFTGKPNFRENTAYSLDAFRNCSAFCSKTKKPNALFKTNCIEDWESKIDAIVEETFNENMTVISGIPSWVQMYFERLDKKENP